MSISEELKKEIIFIVESIIAKIDLPYTNCIIDSNSQSLWLEVQDTLLYNIKLNTYTDINICFNYTCIDNEVIYDNIPLKNKMGMYISHYMNMSNNSNLLVSLDDINEMESYDVYSKMKSSDGCKFFDLLGYDNSKYMIPIFSRFPNLNKGDSFSAFIYPYDNNISRRYLIVKYKIHKKKIKRDYDVYFKTINLCL